MRALQEALWLETEAEPTTETPCVFIIGAPRTGSTVAYQHVCKFTPSFFANITNDFFPYAPIAGLWLQAYKGQTDVKMISRFGHTVGLWQPSEATQTFSYWFGMEQPGEEKASDFLSKFEEIGFLTTLDCMAKLFRRPPIIKNAWNCFRIKLLSTLLPNSHWIWIKRDLAAAAKSDLHARIVTKNDPEAWNACWPKDVEELSRLPYWEQVCENQLAYNKAIDRALTPITERVTIWQYESCFQNGISSWDLSDNDVKAVDKYADEDRFLIHRFHSTLEPHIPAVPEIVTREI